ncbi:Asp23/Gls24 family envelope stress response protein, partial [Kineococcus rubinsiae]|uniref:Asp23/Gls24 family envelope stress response protein n=1 Tax=Kineococcus rubinsiae TaxID=2609562 RepID=UPI001AD91BA7
APADPAAERGREAERGRRGTLRVADRAVERIAEAAALEVPGVAPSGAGTGTLGTALGRAYPRVGCQVAGRRVRADVEIATRWPQPADRVAAAVREHVTERLSTLAALDVDAVDVRVAEVVRLVARDARRVR